MIDVIIIKNANLYEFAYILRLKGGNMSLNEKALKLIEVAKKEFIKKDISLISQQCIGGVIYHDMEMQFLSPTINLYLESQDFLKLVENLTFYMEIPIKIKKENDLIIGYLNDIKIIFLHYNEEEKAKEKWEERKKRIKWDKIFVICTDRDGFDNKCFERFKKLKYPKALITRNEEWKNEEFCVYLEKYKNDKFIPDTIPTRDFYQNNKIIELLNKAYN